MSLETQWLDLRLDQKTLLHKARFTSTSAYAHCIITVILISLCYLCLTLFISLYLFFSMIGTYYHFYAREDFFEEVSSVNVVFSRIVLGVLLVCTSLRLLYETCALLVWLISLLRIWEKTLWLLYILCNISWYLLSFPVWSLWYILSILLREPLQLLWSAISSVFIQTPVAVLQWLYRGPVSYLGGMIAVIVAGPLHVLFWVGRCLYGVLNPIIGAFIWVVLTFVQAVAKFVRFVFDFPTLLVGFVYSNICYILPLVLSVVLIA